MNSEDYIMRDLMKLGYENKEWIQMTRDKFLFEHGNEPAGSLTEDKFVHKLTNINFS
jgi:hypothetical protein